MTDARAADAADAAPADIRALAESHRDTILGLVAESIDTGLETGKPPAVDPTEHDAELAAPGACFVTVEKAGRLRGCIGSLEARRPLVADLVHNAYSAAFRDPRFPPLAAEERPEIACSVSLLSPPEPMPEATSDADLIAALVPGEDGLILAEEDAGDGAEGTRRATFLPQVWEQLPEPADFLARLKIKAGLPADHWSDGMRVWRYRVARIG